VHIELYASVASCQTRDLLHAVIEGVDSVGEDQSNFIGLGVSNCGGWQEMEEVGACGGHGGWMRGSKGRKKWEVKREKL